MKALPKTIIKLQIEMERMSDMNKNIDISNVVLCTERLVLRPWRKTDIEDFFEYASVEGVGQMAGWLPHKNKKRC